VALQPATTQPARPLDPEHLQQAITRLQALPAFYPAVHKALKLLGDPQSSNDHLQQEIGSDQAMAARVLKLANSAYFGFRGRVGTISLAITLIGRDRIGTLLRHFLAEEMIHLLSGRKPAARRIRQLSLLTAAAGHTLAERLLRGDKEEILLAGLLHNIGELVLLSQFRKEYEDMLSLAQPLSASQAELAIFGVESRLVGRWLLEAWNFPPFFPTIAEHHVDPWAESFPDAPVAAIALVYAARKMADLWVERGDPELLSFSPRLLSTLAVDREFLVDLYRHLPEAADRWKRTAE